jgi:hypothetical protein
MKIYKFNEAIENNIAPLKKYVVWYSEMLDQLEILEIVSKEKELTPINAEVKYTYTSKTTHKYDNFEKKLIKTNSNAEETFFNTGIKHYVKYTSNKLKDCKDFINILINSKKYNI